VARVVNVPTEDKTTEDEGEFAGGGLSSRFIAKNSTGDSQSLVTSRPIWSSFCMLLDLIEGSVVLQNVLRSIVRSGTRVLDCRPPGRVEGRLFATQVPQLMTDDFHLVIVRV
jgi:hypothetical protein